MGLLSGIARACLYEGMMLFVSLQADGIRSRYGFVIWNSQGLSLGWHDIKRHDVVCIFAGRRNKVKIWVCYLE